MTESVLQPLWLVPSAAEKGDAGWEHGLPPGITPDQWPRHRSTGLPLVHGFTLRVPLAYRAKGKSRVALSYFHPGDTESYYGKKEARLRVRAILAGEAPLKGEKKHPFWAALLTHRDASHPSVVYYKDVLDHDHAIVWHTERELSGERCARPETPLPDGFDGRAMHLESAVETERALVFSEVEPDRVTIQLGWPLRPVQCSEQDLRARGFGDRVMEIEADVGGANYGDGNCQIDLDRALLDWSCT